MSGESKGSGRARVLLGHSLVMSLSNHEPDRSSFDRPVLSEALILRQAQDERRVEGLRMSGESKGSDERRVEGLRTSECVEPSETRQGATVLLSDLPTPQVLID